jgi:hypothetical protein
MTKRDNELTRDELRDKRLKQLFEAFDMHRGQLPQQLLTAVEGVRKAHDMKDVRVLPPAHAGREVVVENNTDHPVEVHSAVATDAPAKPGDLT